MKYTALTCSIIATLLAFYGCSLKSQEMGPFLYNPQLSNQIFMSADSILSTPYKVQSSYIDSLWFTAFSNSPILNIRYSGGITIAYNKSFNEFTIEYNGNIWNCKDYGTPLCSLKLGSARINSEPGMQILMDESVLHRLRQLNNKLYGHVLKRKI